MSRPINQIYPDQAGAIRSREQAGNLVKYDHHVVQVDGRAGVMLTHEWMPVEEHAGPFILRVVFYHVERHPPATDEIKSIVDGLRFQVRGQPR